MADKILIVDDSIDNRKLLLKTLGKGDYILLEAADGKEALARAFEFLPDLVLLDIVMPELDGYQVCEALKQDPRTADIPVIFLSAKAETQDKIKGLDTGGVDYITKPFDRGEVLARVRTQLRIRNLMKELIDKQKRLDEDLRAAAVIQMSLLPQSLPTLKEIDIAWKFIPCELIGGDIFNVVPLDENHLGFYMVDVSGHGVPAAMVTVSVSQVLQPLSGYLKKKSDSPPYYEIISPKMVLEALDREYPLERFGKFFTMVYLILNIRTGKLIYSSAAHPPTVLLHPQRPLDLLSQGGTIIGLDGVIPFEEEEKVLSKGDKLIFYTDGVVEFQNQHGESYGEERFLALLRSLEDQPLELILDGVCESLTAFGHQARVQDDVTLLGMEFKDIS